MVDFDVAVVIPAAGKSQRFCNDTPKQYFCVNGKPLFLFAVEKFITIEYVKKICIVSDQVEYAQQLLSLQNIKQDKLIFVPGASSRHYSIRNGLDALKKLDTYFKVVVIHDGARPFVPEPLLGELVFAAVEHGAAGATRPLTSTILRPQEDGCLDASLDRSLHVASETPQAFLFEMICDAYQKCSPEELENGTECLKIALAHCGVRAKLIPGPDSLWKVTEKKDCYAAIAAIKESSTRVCIICEKETETTLGLRENLSKNSADVWVYVTSQDDGVPNTANVVVCFHDHDIDPNIQMLLANVLDIDNQGLVVHVVFESNRERFTSGSAFDLLQSGRSMMAQYEKLKKGVVIVHFTSHGEEERLVKLISCLVMADSTIFSGQTFLL